MTWRGGQYDFKEVAVVTLLTTIDVVSQIESHLRHLRYRSEGSYLSGQGGHVTRANNNRKGLGMKVNDRRWKDYTEFSRNFQRRSSS